jgi:hypothetical protein
MTSRFLVNLYFLMPWRIIILFLLLKKLILFNDNLILTVTLESLIHLICNQWLIILLRVLLCLFFNSIRGRLGHLMKQELVQRYCWLCITCVVLHWNWKKKRHPPVGRIFIQRLSHSFRLFLQLYFFRLALNFADVPLELRKWQIMSIIQLHLFNISCPNCLRLWFWHLSISSCLFWH